MPRMNILNAVEREAFDSPPVFNSFQRKQYFDFPSKLRRFAAGLRSPAYRVGFLLSAGYFKAVKRFFSPGAFHRRDIEYVTRQLELGVPMVDLASYHPRAMHRAEFWETFRNCLSKLPQRVAHVFMLREMEGMETEQICRDLNISPNNLWVMLHRARMALRECLEINWFKDPQQESG
jgi:RNA polymerase sigma factor (sigma-70 family)